MNRLTARASPNFEITARRNRSCCSVQSQNGSFTLKGAVLDIVARGPSDAIRASERVSPAIVAWRGTGSRPTGKRAAQDTVARGPVPRDRETARETRSHARVASEGPSPTVKRKVGDTVARGPVPRDRSLARDRPSPYGKTGRSGYRSVGALGCHARIRAGFPRDRCLTDVLSIQGEPK